jgi:hypothetical protein
MDKIYLGVTLILILIFIIYKNTITELLRIPLGIINTKTGKYMIIIHHLFWFLRPKYFFLDTQDKFFKKVDCNKI